jgi:phosphoglycerate dehydrogenase-like enzyme
LGLSKDATARAARLRWLHCSAHAVGQFPVADLAARGITVTNSRGIQSTPIAEHVMACLLALARRLPQTLKRQEQRVWLPDELTGHASPWLIAGKTMGIIGLGTLGQAIAVRAKAFGMRVTGMRRNPERGVPDGIDEVIARSDLDRMLDVADVVVLAAPLTPGTNQILDAAAIAKMKPGAVVINVARGQLLDESALATALAAGRLGGAVLDVFTTEPLSPDSPFWSMPNVIVTPHTSGFRTDHFDAVIDLFSENLRRFERGGSLLNLVDMEAGY